MEYREFKAQDLQGLEVNEFVSFIQPDLENPKYGEFLENGEAYTAMVDGRVIACAGFMPLGKNRCHAWALFSPETRNYMTSIVRFAKNVVYNIEMPRIETNIREDFAQAIKFIELLGFIRETPLPMKNFGDDDMDYYLYARCA